MRSIGSAAWAVAPKTLEKDVDVQEEADPQRSLQIVERHEAQEGQLISILEKIQTACGYLPEDALRKVADTTGRSLVDVFAVATFYRSFTLQPRGKHLIRVCLGTACHVRGAARIAEEFQRQLGVKPGETTPDRDFTLETVNCLGACALGPVVVIDGRYFSKVMKARVKPLINEAREGFDRTDVGEDKRIFPIDVSCPRCNHSLMDKTFTIDGSPSIRLTASSEGKCGWLRFSSLYGNYRCFSEHDVPADTVARFFCPHCHLDLVGPWDCPMCGAPMAPMIVRGGGMLQLCMRHGCKGHMLDVV